MPLRRFAFRKLVRDNIPDILKEKGMTPYTKTLTPDLATVWLKAKLVEEADEATRANSREKMKEELADVFEAAHALAKSYGITSGEIEIARGAKLKTHGGFTNLTFVTHVDIESTNPETGYFKARAEDFPEIPANQFEPAA